MRMYFSYLWNSKWALATATGILLGLSYPPVPLPFLVFPAFFLIFRIIDLSGSAREAAYWTYPAFVIWNLITTYWLMMATFAGGVAAILANSVVMTIPVMLQYKVQRKNLAPWLIALLQTAFWLSFEFLHHHWDLAWPWLTVANAWANVPQLVQYISVTGYWGISIWVLLSVSMGYQFYKTRERIPRVGTALAIAVFPLWSAGILLLGTDTEPDYSQQVVVVQPNFDSYQQHGGFDSPYRANEHLIRLTDSVRTEDTRLVVWPENAIQAQISNLDSFSEASRRTKDRLERKAIEWGATLIAGATYFQFYSANQAPRLPYPSSRGPYLPYNSALGFYPDSSREMEVYRKHNLVPIVERIPFVHFLNTIDLFNLVSWNTIQNYGKGYRADSFSVGKTQTPALICYDSVFPSWTKTYVQKGAGYLTIITNDGWWGNTSGHEQHFAYARLRAIELDRWIVRSANNGISGIIAPDGSVAVETPYWQQTAFRYEVPVHSSLTLYARFGDWLPALMLALSAMGIGLIGYDRFSRNNP